MEDDLIIFSTEELAQAFSLSNLSNYYVYYDKKTGNILSVTNERNDKLEYFVEVEKTLADPFLNGEQNFTDYCVVYDDNIGLTIIPKEDEYFIRRTNIFEIIKPTSDLTKVEFVVEWDMPRWGWNFYLTAKAKDRLKDEGLSQRVAIFITDASDLNILIRTIYLDTSVLLYKERIYQSFVSEKEYDLTKLNITTKLVFETYGLTTTYE